MHKLFKKPMDIFFAVYDVEETKDEIRSRFPRAKFCIIDENHTIQDALYEAQSRSTTKMFWFVNFGHDIVKDFDFSYDVPEWDQQYVHVFKDDLDNYKNVYIIPKHYAITKREAEHVFFINKKEIDIRASQKKSSDIFFVVYDVEETKDKIRSRFPTAKFCIIDENYTVQDAIYEAQSRSSTDMFWFIEPDYEPVDNVELNYQVSSWDQIYVHVFQERKTGKYTGSYLIPKKYKITKNEAEHVFFIDKKEISQVVSTVIDYEVFTVTTYDDYLRAKEVSATNMFYVVFSDLKISDDFKFNHVIDKKSKHLNYVFKNGTSYDGIILTSKTQTITEKEFENRFIMYRSEIDVKASDVEKYEIITCNSYEEYLEKITKVRSAMSYLITDNFIVNSDFDFDYQVPKWNQDKVHIFKNGKYFDGICLFPANKTVSQREFNYRFFINKMEIDIMASMPKQFDIVFISYNEPNADENYQNLVKKFPKAKRIHGVEGIHNAHKKAAEIVETAMFWVVDGDAHVLDDFNFDHQVPLWSFDVVHVCRSKNPINGLEYGYGGVKLLPTQLTKDLNIDTVDMTTSISSKFRVLPIVSNVSKFNTDEFNTWKSAFRECAKLSSKIITGQTDKETVQRLDIWCTEGKEQPFGEYAIKGAIQGKEFGLGYKDNPSMLSKINDWKWLEKKFKGV